MRVLHPQQTLYIISHFNFRHSFGVQQYVIVILICITLKIKMRLGTFYMFIGHLISFLRHGPIQVFFAHFLVVFFLSTPRNVLIF